VEVLVLEIMQCVVVHAVPVSCSFGQMPKYLVMGCPLAASSLLGYDQDVNKNLCHHFDLSN
jgi:hypothetical protein